MSEPRPAAGAVSHFAALSHRNFRLLWAGQLVSNAGSLMQTAAILWHVSLLVAPEKRGLALGMVGLVRVLPIVGFSLLAGVAADALDRRRVMLVTQSGMALTAGVLGLLTFRGSHSVFPVYLLAALSSSFGSFDGPARQSLIPNLVPREHLPNAITLNTIMFQVASVAGPALGGIVIAAAGVAWVYALNAVSFLCVIAALLLMRDVRARAGDEKGEVSLRAMREGLAFVFRAPLIRASMLLDFFATFFASATALLPIYAQDILRVGASGYGVLSAAPSVGAAVASVAMVPLNAHLRRRGQVLLWAVAGFGVATVAFGFSRSFPVTFLCLALTGVTDTVSVVIRNVIRHLNTPDSLRGRMTSVNMIFFMGGPQLGELEAGLVAQLWGAAVSVVTGGLGCLVATGWVAARTPELRRYEREEAPATPASAGATSQTA